MAAYRDSAPGRLVLAAFLLYCLAGAGLVGMIVWRVWQAVTL